MRKCSVIVIHDGLKREIINVSIKHCGSNSVIDFTKLVPIKYDSIHYLIKSIVEVCKYNNNEVRCYKQMNSKWYDINFFDVHTNKSFECYSYRD